MTEACHADGIIYLGWRFRQGKVKRRAAPGVAVGPYPATMRFHDGATNHQAHAATLGFGDKEGVKDLFRFSVRLFRAGFAFGVSQRRL